MILASLNTNCGGKHRNAMNRSLMKRRILWCHISKSRTANFLKFRILNSLMPLIMCSKFQTNQIILTLFSGVWDKNKVMSNNVKRGKTDVKSFYGSNKINSISFTMLLWNSKPFIGLLSSQVFCVCCLLNDQGNSVTLGIRKIKKNKRKAFFLQVCRHYGLLNELLFSKK